MCNCVYSILLRHDASLLFFTSRMDHLKVHLKVPIHQKTFRYNNNNNKFMNSLWESMRSHFITHNRIEPALLVIIVNNDY